MDAVITIEVVKGGYILHYPTGPNTGNSLVLQEREIFTSSRKLNQKIKEVLDYTSTTPADAGDTE